MTWFLPRDRSAAKAVNGAMNRLPRGVITAATASRARACHYAALLSFSGRAGRPHKSTTLRDSFRFGNSRVRRPVHKARGRCIKTTHRVAPAGRCVPTGRAAPENSRPRCARRAAGGHGRCRPSSTCHSFAGPAHGCTARWVCAGDNSATSSVYAVVPEQARCLVTESALRCPTVVTNKGGLTPSCTSCQPHHSRQKS